MFLHCFFCCWRFDILFKIFLYNFSIFAYNFFSGMKISIIRYVSICSTMLIFSSCEKDDLCGGVNAKTPLVNIEFFNKENISQRKIFQELVCFSPGGDTVAKLFKNDSKISLPLKLNDTKTSWILEKREIRNSDTIRVIDTLHFVYKTKAMYISKACGYRSVFFEVSTTINNNNSRSGHWIESHETLQDIFNENDTHVKILY